MLKPYQLQIIIYKLKLHFKILQTKPTSTLKIKVYLQKKILPMMDFIKLVLKSQLYNVAYNYKTQVFIAIRLTL